MSRFNAKLQHASAALTVPEVAEELRIGTTLVRQLIKTGELPAKRIGRRVVVAREVVDDYVRPDPDPRSAGGRR
jgi:excisionase family DNA binding protein